MIEWVNAELKRNASGILAQLGLDGIPDINFDVPDGKWAESRMGPNKPDKPQVNFYLYEVREDLGRRQDGTIQLFKDKNRYTPARASAPRRRPDAWHDPPRYFTLSYLITSWMANSDHAVRALEALLVCFARITSLGTAGTDPLLTEPNLGKDPTKGQHLGRLQIPVAVNLTQPLDNRAISELWTALHTPPRPSVDLKVTVPLETFTVHTTTQGTWATELQYSAEPRMDNKYGPKNRNTVKIKEPGT